MSTRPGVRLPRGKTERSLRIQSSAAWQRGKDQLTRNTCCADHCRPGVQGDTSRSTVTARQLGRWGNISRSDHCRRIHRSVRSPAPLPAGYSLSSPVFSKSEAAEPGQVCPNHDNPRKNRDKSRENGDKSGIYAQSKGKESKGKKNKINDLSCPDSAGAERDGGEYPDNFRFARFPLQLELKLFPKNRCDSPQTLV